jgi:hypothetical protein
MKEATMTIKLVALVLLTLFQPVGDNSNARFFGVSVLSWLDFGPSAGQSEGGRWWDASTMGQHRENGFHQLSPHRRALDVGDG